MLKSIHRLSTKQFMEVMEKGRIYTSPLFVVRVLDRSLEIRNKSLEEKQITFGISAVAPKKVAPTAVLRNKTRRQIYEAIKPLIHTIAPGVAVIVFAKKETLQASFEIIKSDLKQLFSKAKISV